MGDFDHGTGFEAGAIVAELGVGAPERYWGRLLGDMLSDGVLTDDERQRLGEVAESLALEPARLQSLEHALVSAYEARHGQAVVYGGAEAARAPYAANARTAVGDADEAADQATLAASQRVAELEQRVSQLQAELAEGRARAPVEVDLAAVAPLDHAVAPTATGATPPDEIGELERRIATDPRDVLALSKLFRLLDKEPDRRWCVAAALVFLGAADVIELSAYRQGQRDGLIRPERAVEPGAWDKLLRHRDEDPLNGEILASIVGPVLLGHVSAKRRAGTLPSLDPSHWLDVASSPLPIARAFAWAGQILGVQPPLLYADDGEGGLARLAPGVPPAIRLGRDALAPRHPCELAFVAGRCLAAWRPERFIRLLFPEVADLESLFLAALAIGRPELRLRAEVERRVSPLAQAIRRYLETAAVGSLHDAFGRFVAAGGRTNLQLWAFGADCTAARAGLLLAGDLSLAARMLELERAPRHEELIGDLIAFSTSRHYAMLRWQIGVGLA